MEDETRISASTPLEMRAKARASREVDRQSEDSFPASDPPSYNGGSIVGAPEGRSGSPPEHPAHAILRIAHPEMAKPGGCPQFCNDLGVKEIRIGAQAFECIGETPPQDHPHIYLELGEQTEILCPYCGTLFCFDPGLSNLEADPPESLFYGSY